MSSRLVYQTCAWWRHLVYDYVVISLVQLIAAAYRRRVAAFYLAKPIVIPGLRAGTCAVLRGSLLIVCKQARLSFV